MPTKKLIICDTCKTSFYRDMKHINQSKKNNWTTNHCSTRCIAEYRYSAYSKLVTCSTCDKSFKKLLSNIKKSKSGNHFCSRSCSATYNNMNKKHGTRRSKFELWAEQELIKLYPNYNILFNDKTTIKSELDIYFHDLKMAIEINGIFHYKPIYGEDKLKKIQENDRQKALLCEENNITLHSIDTSKLKKMADKNAIKYLEIIKKLVEQGGLEPP